MFVHATGFQDEPLRNENDTPDDWPDIGRASNSQGRDDNRDLAPVDDDMEVGEGEEESSRKGGEEDVDAEDSV